MSSIQRISPLVEQKSSRSKSVKTSTMGSKIFTFGSTKRSTKKKQSVKTKEEVLTDDEINHLIKEFDVVDNEKDQVFQELKQLKHDSRFSKHNEGGAAVFYAKNKTNKHTDLYNQAFAIMMLLVKNDGNFKSLGVNTKTGRFEILL